MMPTERAVIALGSNLGDRLANLRAAGTLLGTLGEIRGRSPIYETAPLGPAQPDYLNAVVLLETGLPPERLMPALLAIERTLGRVRGDRWGPRLIDLDLIAFDGRVIDTPDLTIPHPEASRRAFVLAPLCDVAPGTPLRTASGDLEPAAAILAALPESDKGLRRLEESW